MAVSTVARLHSLPTGSGFFSACSIASVALVLGFEGDVSLSLTSKLEPRAEPVQRSRQAKLKPNMATPQRSAFRAAQTRRHYAHVKVMG
jgi:hypothetical protein